MLQPLKCHWTGFLKTKGKESKCLLVSFVLSQSQGLWMNIKNRNVAPVAGEPALVAA